MGHRSMPTPSPLKRRARAAGIALFLALGAAPAHAETAPAIVAVSVDNAKVIRLPERTQTVIVGNPLVADVALQRNGIVILTGKSFGSTNLIALDASGTMLAETTISVQAAQGSIVTVQRGLDRESYSCTPNCMPSMQLGDATKYFGDVSGQADARRNLATGGGGSGGGQK
ncbi:pilus assembly protein N-terminal domain-containing protein [Methylobacterium sp. 88A]|uniref:pilus assembly protein N-terminal domain-containing protein n=1 Tax=Methylobacterium sp. 88A TaxID=1131813 RepID=UPI0003A5E9BF|nr:pilus assembly protein N-terminal domain-containing protein [Methylobacterium sp. 88A]